MDLREKMRERFVHPKPQVYRMPGNPILGPVRDIVLARPREIIGCSDRISGTAGQALTLAFGTIYRRASAAIPQRARELCVHASGAPLRLAQSRLVDVVCHRRELQLRPNPIQFRWILLPC